MQRALVCAILFGCGAGEAMSSLPLEDAPTSPGAAATMDARGASLAAVVASDAATDANAACERCHQEIAVEWRSSLHRSAWDDPVFLAAYVIEPQPFCRGCHAPEAPLEDANAPARHLGVGCVTCHVADPKAIVASGAAHARTRPRHDARGEGCASCHQFEFPEPQESAMQSTLEEHARSPERDRSCESCHMRASADATEHTDHRFRVQGDTELLRGALAISARPGRERTVVVSLAARGAGHAVPTGDMFRRLELRAWAGAGERALEAEPVVLAREFEMVATERGRRRMQIGDRRVPASGEPIEVELVFPQPIGARPVRWEVVYRRMGPREAALFGVELQSEQVVIAEGTLDVPAAMPAERERRSR